MKQNKLTMVATRLKVAGTKAVLRRLESKAGSMYSISFCNFSLQSLSGKLTTLIF